MISVTQAQELVLQHTRRLPVATVELGVEALGQVLAEDVVSDLDMPPYEKALVDGYAVRTADVGTHDMFEVIEEIPAGRPPTRSLLAGQTARIMTGGQVPAGADAVVMIERSELVGTDRVRLDAGLVKPGQNILPQGREMRRGETVLTAGAMLRPQELGLLAAVGKTRFRVYPRPRVAVLSTGDELVEPHAAPGPGQIRNSNATMLMTQVVRAGGVPQYLGIAADRVEALESLVREGLRSDVLLLSGGVSAGKLDLVPEILQRCGVQAVFHKVAMKPGKPLFHGVTPDCLVFGLPGNPVSSLVGFELFVRPALRRLRGLEDPGTGLYPARLTRDYQHRSDRPTYHPARLEHDAQGRNVTPVAWFGSPDLRAISQANAFVLFSPDRTEYQMGENVPVLATE